MKVFFKNLKTFVRKNLISCACFLLTILVTITGSVSYSKYVSTSPVDGNPNAGSFSCTAKIDGVSALSFTNTAFWGGTSEEDKIAMNALRTIDFSVYNYNYQEEGSTPSEVKLGYTLMFTAPANFITKLAFQLFNDEDQPLLPQIVAQDLMEAASNTFNTEDSKDYNGTETTDLSFAVTFSNGVYTAKSGEIVIAFTPFVQKVEQTLNFRLWDTSKIVGPGEAPLEIEGGTLLSPLTVKYIQEVVCYKISIYIPEFKLEAGNAIKKDFSIKIAPTNTIEDGHLGGTFVDSDNKLITEIYSDTEKNWKLRTLKENYTDIYVHDLNDSLVEDESNTNYIRTKTWSQNVMGSEKKYTAGTTDSVENTFITVDTVTNESSTENNEAGDPPYAVTANTAVADSKLQTKTQFEAEYEGKFDEPETEEDWWYGTRITTYTYKADVEKQITKTTVRTTTITYTTTTTTTETNVTESIYIDSVSDDKLTIVQHITEETEVKQSKNTTTTKKTIIEKVTETRTIKGVHTCVYEEAPWDSYRTSCEIVWEGGTTLEDQFNAAPRAEETKTTISETIETPDSTTSTTTIPTTQEYIVREINRQYATEYIIITEVSRMVDGNTVVYYDGSDSSKIFNLLGKDGAQDFFISQSYSKNYPLTVDVLFEQILE